MPRVIGKLSARKVSTAKPSKGQRAAFLSDGGNLNLQVTLGDAGNVRRSWVFLYQIDGKKRAMGLGPTHTLNLHEAREKARSLRQQLLDGIDPLEAKEAAHRAKVAETAKTVTFAQCAEMYFNLHERGWSAEHRRQWSSSLRIHVLPQIGTMAVRDIDQATVMKIVEPIWKSRTVTAGRVRARIEAILDYATAHRFREGDNPAHVLSALPKQGKIAKVEHLPALPWQEIPQFMAEVRALSSMPARCAEFLILTAARPGEALGARWDEIDLKNRTWVISGERMKAGIEHRVPLSSAALELLSGLPRTGPLVFGGSKQLQETILRRMVLAKLRPNGMKRRQSAITVHGMRSAFKTWASESTAFPRDVVEVALAHKRGGKVEQAYERGDLFTKRARLMDQWAKFCAKPAPAAAAADVISLRSAASSS
jgi:integrase